MATTTDDWIVTTEFLLRPATADDGPPLRVRLVATQGDVRRSHSRFTERLEGLSSPHAGDDLIKELVRAHAPNGEAADRIAKQLLRAARVPRNGSPPREWRMLTTSIANGTFAHGAVVHGASPIAVLVGEDVSVLVGVSLSPGEPAVDGLGRRIEIALDPDGTRNDERAEPGPGQSSTHAADAGAGPGEPGSDAVTPERRGTSGAGPRTAPAQQGKARKGEKGSKEKGEKGKKQRKGEKGKKQRKGEKGKKEKTGGKAKKRT